MILRHLIPRVLVIIAIIRLPILETICLHYIIQPNICCAFRRLAPIHIAQILEFEFSIIAIINRNRGSQDSGENTDALLGASFLQVLGFEVSGFGRLGELWGLGRAVCVVEDVDEEGGSMVSFPEDFPVF